MKGAVIGELISLKKSLWLLVPICLFGGIGATATPIFLPIVSGYMSAVYYMAQGADIRSHWDMLAAATPAGKKGYIGAKYITGIIVSASASVTAFLPMLIFQPPGGLTAVTFLFLPMAFSVGLIIPSVFMPFFAKFGYNGAMAAIFIAGAVTVLSMKISQDVLMNRDIVMDDVLNVGLSPIGWVGAVVLFLLSWKLSDILFAKRDL